MFGMGTGITPLPWSPAMTRYYHDTAVLSSDLQEKLSKKCSDLPLPRRQFVVLVKKHPATGVTGCMIHVRKRQPQAWLLDE